MRELANYLTTCLFELYRPVNAFSIGDFVLAGGELPALDRELVINRDNIRITRSVRIKPGTYHVADQDKNGVLRIEADNVVMELKDANSSCLITADPGSSDRHVVMPLKL